MNLVCGMTSRTVGEAFATKFIFLDRRIGLSRKTRRSFTSMRVKVTCVMGDRVMY